MLHKTKNSHSFTPPLWARNRHIQTIWPRYFIKRPALKHTKQRLELPDGDFVDLAWSERPVNCKGLVVLFHGLEGSIESHYAHNIMAELVNDNWWAVMMHFRGCSGEPNRLTRSYHSGDTGDAMFLLQHLQDIHIDAPATFAVGFSLGGNMLLKLLGENPGQDWIKAGIAISPPLQLAECADNIGKGFSRHYQNYLLKSMCDNMLAKMQRMDMSDALTISAEEISNISSFREFDQHITAPLHGFKDAEDYYRQSSSGNYLHLIDTPALVIHSQDDPFMTENVVPDKNRVSPLVQMEISRFGGHVGFMQGSPWNPVNWYHQRVLDYLDTMHFQHTKG